MDNIKRFDKIMLNDIAVAYHQRDYGHAGSIQENNNDQFDELSPILPLVETRPGLRTKDKLFLVCLIVILVVGFSIGTYLILDEGHEWKSLEINDFTNRPISRISFFSTNTTSCKSKFHCYNLATEVFTEETEEKEVYHFLIGGCGSIFQNQLWNGIVNVGFLGNVCLHGPSVVQTEAVKLLLKKLKEKSVIDTYFTAVVGDKCKRLAETAKETEKVLSNYESHV